jgi:hypothetical protein
MSEKNPEIVGSTKLELRPRVLSDKHFEFRDVEVPNVVPGQHQGLSVSRLREARLRPEYGHVYPWLLPDTWELAAVVVEKVLGGRLQRRRELVERERLKPRYFGLPVLSQGPGRSLPGKPGAAE